MIIEEIRLRNIRSHPDSTIRFQDGINIVHGDVGAGKSSVLYAIEFAFFGTGSRFGKNDIKLLRAGERSGSVDVVTDIDGTKCTFHRELSDRGDRGGYIVKDGVKFTYSASEMRENALKMLNLKEPRSTRSKSYIYEYAIFTPQEEMKKILEDRPEDRMKLLRKAFGLIDYANARDNATLLSKDLSNENDKLKAYTEQLPDMRDKLNGLEREISELIRLQTEATGLLEGYRNDAERIEKEINEKERRDNELEIKERDLLGVKKEIGYLEKDVARLEDDLEKIRLLRAELDRLQRDYEEYEKLEAVIREEYRKKNAKESNRRQIESLDEEIKRIERGISEKERSMAGREDLVNNLARLKMELTGFETLEREKDENTKKMALVRNEIDSIKSKLRDLDAEEKNYEDLEGRATCPKCGQTLEGEHLKKVKEGIRKNREEILLRIKELEREEGPLRKERESIEERAQRKKDLEKKLQEGIRKQDELAHVAREISDRKKEAEAKREKRGDLVRESEAIGAVDTERLEKERNSLKKGHDGYIQTTAEIGKEDRIRENLGSEKKRIEELRDREGTLEGMIKGLGPVREELISLRDREKKLTAEISKLEERLRNIEAKMAEMERERTGLNQEIEELERKEERRRHIEEVIGWLRKFAESMDTIEKNVVNLLNAEFQQTFQKLFSELIEGGEITVDVDEEFTPVIKENSMDINLSSLSGGERTSVAMAYRLALNRTVQRESTGMKESMIILDEPTDGFSGEQIEKFGDLLRGMGCKQIVLVSHEQELISFADHVIRIGKENGVSRVM